MSVLIKLAIGITVACSFASFAIDIDDLMPFGPENGDNTAYRGDDDYDEVPLSRNFSFYGTNHSTLFVNTNGLISFEEDYTAGDGDCTTSKDSIKKMLIFWADVELEEYELANIYYRQTTDETDLKKVREYLPSVSVSDGGDGEINGLNWAFIATWDRVTFYGVEIDDRSFEEGPVPQNTFQAILAANDKYSYAIYLYENITWIGDDEELYGLEGDIAIIGFDSGDGESSYFLQESCKESMIGLEGRSNVRRPGMYVFRVDGHEIHDVFIDFARRCSQNGRMVNEKSEQTCVCNKGWKGTFCETKKHVLQVYEWQERNEAYFTSDANDFVIKSIPNPMCNKFFGTRGCKCHEDHTTFLTKWFFSYKCIVECNNKISPSAEMITLTEVYCDFSMENMLEMDIGSVSWSAECHCPKEAFHSQILITIPTTNFTTMLLEYNNLKCADPAASHESAKQAFDPDCARDSYICDFHAMCIHNSGSLSKCVCKDGFTGDGIDCHKLCELSNNDETLRFSTSNEQLLGVAKMVSEVDNITMHCTSGAKELTCGCDGNIIGEQDCGN